MRRSRSAPNPRLGRALLTTAAAAAAPGLGHLILRRRRTGVPIFGAFLLGVLCVAALALVVPSSEVIERLLDTRVLTAIAIGLTAVALGWVTVIARTYVLARPARLRTGQRVLGATVAAALCLVVAVPLGFAAHLVESQRALVDTLFPGGRGGDPAAIGKPQLNVLLLGSDAGPDRAGNRTDTMMVASLDTRTGRTVLFGLPRNLAYAPFPPGSAADREFPDGFHDSSAPRDYLLNAVYGYGHEFPEVAPAGPTDDPGMNLLQSSVGAMLGLSIDYHLEVDMAGFAALIDALGGLEIDVGPEPIPVGGITASGREVEPDRFVPAGLQRLDGEDALAVARSRTGSTDYVRMGRQRCLIQGILEQKSPTDLLTNFQAVSAATSSSVNSNIPKEVLPALVSLAAENGLELESVSFDPSLADPDEADGRFNPNDPDYAYMREVVRDTLSGPPATSGPATPSPVDPSGVDRNGIAGTGIGGTGGTGDTGTGTAAAGATADEEPPPVTGPAPIAASC